MPEASESQAFLDPEASREYLRSWQERVDRAAARAAAMSEELDRLRVTARDPNGLAEVTIDSGGVLVDLVLADRSRRFDAETVSRAVMQALRKARTEAADRAHDIAMATMGPDSFSARTTADRLRQALEQPDSEARATERRF